MELATFVSLYAVPIVQSILAYCILLFVYMLLSRGLKRLGHNGYLHPHLVIISCKVLKWVLLIIVILLCLGFFEVPVGTMWATLSGILALIALGFFATWSVLSNTLCSILLIIFPPFRIGDTIEIQEPTNDFKVRGRVHSINMLTTTLHCEDSDDDKSTVILRIPNNIFFQKYVRVIPGKVTQSLKKYVSTHQQAATAQETLAGTGSVEEKH